ncbi:MAG TPA: HDOD domain-containing protein [Rhodocyclaceae bacterium]|nr:HDOD domain-containing protein [Rhodocyclaceae bacterium]
MGRLGLQGWVDHIRDQDMPAFGHTVDSVLDITSDENASITMLSRVILQDAALTTKVLKLSNSVIFNPARQPISTISRAVTVLGFNVLGQVVLSICLIDAFLVGGLRGRVAAEMARCFHAAVQARGAADACGVAQIEEVFIATLLGRVGEMAFWCFGGETAIALDQALIEQPDERPENLQMDLLSFRLRSLTASLAREWRLGSLVVSAAEPAAYPSPAEKAIVMGHRLATAAEKGWESSVATKALTAYAEMLQKPMDEVRALVSSNAAEASRVAAQFGATDAARLIPVPDMSVAEADIARAAAAPEADPMLQLRILRDLAMMLTGKPSLNEVLNLVLEGIYRGLGMHRAVFAMLTTDRTTLQGKAGLGHDAEALVKRFLFRLDGAKGELINEIFTRNEAFWLREPLPRGISITRFEKVMGIGEGFIAPITTHGRAIGVFFAEYGAHPPDEDTWQGFQHFVQQASLSFEHVATRSPKR